MAARQTIVILNGSSVLSDQEAAYPIPMMQKQFDTQVLPAWGELIVAPQLEFETMANIGKLPADCWPMILNRHSADPGALGWHTKDGVKVYGRIYVGDCLQYGISWTVDCQHELIETCGDPTADLLFTMPDGTRVARELCDAVESDDQAVIIDGVKLSNFTYPSYFGNGGAQRYDFQQRLKGPCSALTPGGYMEILPPGATAWTMKQEDRIGGLAGRRFQMRRFRRELRIAKIVRPAI